MKIKTVFSLSFLALSFLFTGCGGNGLKKDAAKFGDLMCRNIEVMSKLRIVDPKDTAAAKKLQSQSEALQKEMEEANKAFNKKYGEQVKSPEFSKKFSRELRKAMLDCPYLSKQDKAQFEKDISE
jgi:hypothetical protein